MLSNKEFKKTTQKTKKQKNINKSFLLTDVWIGDSAAFGHIDAIGRGFLLSILWVSAFAISTHT